MTIIVTIQRLENGFDLHSSAGSIRLETSAPELLNTRIHDFAAWYFLPVAMRRAEPLHIAGNGRPQTAQNAERLAAIWSSWLPDRFSPIRLTFDACDASTAQSHEDLPELTLFSGGLDSTYTVLQRHAQGGTRDLLTVHGMDYHIEDSERFEYFLTLTDTLAKQVAQRRIIVRSDAYSLYNRHHVDPRQGFVSHIFVLAGAAFMFSERYRDIVIAADYREDQQILFFPCGSNPVTNSLFADGVTRLLTDGEDVTRTEKAAFMATRPDMLRTLTFCTDYSFRPHNCGVCQKCMRTKLMFFVASGEIPAIFHDSRLGEKPLAAFNRAKQAQRTFLLEILMHAESNGTLARIPDGARTLQGFRTASLGNRLQESQFVRNLRRTARGILQRLKSAR